MRRDDLPVGVAPLDDECHKRATYLAGCPAVPLEAGAQVGYDHTSAKATGV